MARIKVHLYANLRTYVGGQAAVDLEIAAGSTIRQVLQQLQIPEDQTRIVFVNHRAARLDDPLQEGQRLDLFSAIGGG